MLLSHTLRTASRRAVRSRVPILFNAYECGTIALALCRPQVGVVSRGATLVLQKTPKRNYSTGVSKEESSPNPREIPHIISTLDPKKLTPSDYVDFSGRRRVLLDNGSGEAFLKIVSPFLSSWPTGSGGFIYFHAAPLGAPVEAASVRIRITNDPDPGSFAQGKDLTYNGLPIDIPCVYATSKLVRWFIKKESLLSYKHKQNLFITSTKIRERAGVNKFLRHPYITPLIYSTSQPFVLDLAHVNHNMWLMVEHDGEIQTALFTVSTPSIVLPEQEREQNPTLKDGNAVGAYQGTVIVQFERPHFHLRVLKIVEPIKPARDFAVNLPEVLEGQHLPLLSRKSGNVIESPLGFFGDERQRWLLEHLADLPPEENFAGSTPSFTPSVSNDSSNV